MAVACAALATLLQSYPGGNIAQFVESLCTERILELGNKDSGASVRGSVEDAVLNDVAQAWGSNLRLSLFPGLRIRLHLAFTAYGWTFDDELGWLTEKQKPQVHGLAMDSTQLVLPAGKPCGVIMVAHDQLTAEDVQARQPCPSLAPNITAGKNLYKVSVCVCVLLFIFS